MVSLLCPRLSPSCHQALCPAICAFPPNYSLQRCAERGKQYVVRAVWGGGECLVEPCCKRLRSRAGELLNNQR